MDGPHEPDHRRKDLPVCDRASPPYFACWLTFFTDRENGAETRHNGAFVQDAITFASVIDDNQPTLWQDRVRLDPNFWRSLRDHPVPVREEAIQAIGTRSLAI